MHAEMGTTSKADHMYRGINHSAALHCGKYAIPVNRRFPRESGISTLTIRLSRVGEGIRVEKLVGGRA